MDLEEIWLIFGWNSLFFTFSWFCPNVVQIVKPKKKKSWIEVVKRQDIHHVFWAKFRCCRPFFCLDESYLSLVTNYDHKVWNCGGVFFCVLIGQLFQAFVCGKFQVAWFTKVLTSTALHCNVVVRISNGSNTRWGWVSQMWPFFFLWCDMVASLGVSIHRDCYLCLMSVPEQMLMPALLFKNPFNIIHHHSTRQGLVSSWLPFVVSLICQNELTRWAFSWPTSQIRRGAGNKRECWKNGAAPNGTGRIWLILLMLMLIDVDVYRSYWFFMNIRNIAMAQNWYLKCNGSLWEAGRCRIGLLDQNCRMARLYFSGIAMVKAHVTGVLFLWFLLLSG